MDDDDGASDKTIIFFKENNREPETGSELFSL